MLTRSSSITSWATSGEQVNGLPWLDLGDVLANAAQVALLAYFLPKLRRRFRDGDRGRSERPGRD